MSQYLQSSPAASLEPAQQQPPLIHFPLVLPPALLPALLLPLSFALGLARFFAPVDSRGRETCHYTCAAVQKRFEQRPRVN